MTIAVVVEITMTPGQEDAFKRRVCQHRDTVRQNEPGCRRFDVLIPREGTGKVMLFEAYADADALDHHMNSPHMRVYREATAAMVADRVITVCDVAGP